MHARPAPKRKKSLTSNFSRSTVLLSPHTRRVSSSSNSFSPKKKVKNLSRLNDTTEWIECVLNASFSLAVYKSDHPAERKKWRRIRRSQRMGTRHTHESRSTAWFYRFLLSFFYLFSSFIFLVLSLISHCFHSIFTEGKMADRDWRRIRPITWKKKVFYSFSFPLLFSHTRARLCARSFSVSLSRTVAFSLSFLLSSRVDKCQFGARETIAMAKWSHV